MNKSSIKVDFDINIRAAYILHESVPENTTVKITWIRGTKSIDTNSKQIIGKRVIFNDKFAMKTKIDIVDADTLSPKETQL